MPLLFFLVKGYTKEHNRAESLRKMTVFNILPTASRFWAKAYVIFENGISATAKLLGIVSGELKQNSRFHLGHGKNIKDKEDDHEDSRM